MTGSPAARLRSSGKRSESSGAPTSAASRRKRYMSTEPSTNQPSWASKARQIPRLLASGWPSPPRPASRPSIECVVISKLCSAICEP